MMADFSITNLGMPCICSKVDCILK